MKANVTLEWSNHLTGQQVLNLFVEQGGVMNITTQKEMLDTRACDIGELSMKVMFDTSREFNDLVRFMRYDRAYTFGEFGVRIKDIINEEPF